MSEGLYTGILEVDALVPDNGGVHGSLKHKRAVLRPVLARLRRLEVAVCEFGPVDAHGRAGIGVACVAGDAGRVRQVLDTCERQLSREVEIEVVAARVRLVGPQDGED